MYHDPALTRGARSADPRPASAVSHGVGLAGLAGLCAWIGVAKAYGMDGPLAGLTALVAAALPMIVWSLAIDRVHRRASTGIDWSRVRALSETIDVSLAKLAGLWATWAAIAAIYATARFYWEGPYSFAMWCLSYAAPVVVVLSVPWVMWFDRRLTEPRDGAWALGAWLLNLNVAVDREAIWNHLRSWGVKAFFLAFMLAIVPGNFGDFIRTDLSTLSDPVAIARALIAFMFVIDVAFACVGYVLTVRVLDSHIRSANPYAAGWMAALMCYPPFILMSEGGPLDYHPGTSDWTHWLAGYPLLLAAVGAVLVALTVAYAWATVAFGLRFSNLTHRGILTHGPYALSRHPAYLSKNLFWWLSTIPILTTTGNASDALRNTAIMALVSGVYYWRAKTEERHLSADPAYRDYSAWMARNGPVPRLLARLRG